MNIKETLDKMADDLWYHEDDIDKVRKVLHEAYLLGKQDSLIQIDLNSCEDEIDFAYQEWLEECIKHQLIANTLFAFRNGARWALKKLNGNVGPQIQKTHSIEDVLEYRMGFNDALDRAEVALITCLYIDVSSKDLKRVLGSLRKV